MDKPFASYKIEERSFVAYIKREIHQEVVKSEFKEKQIAGIDIIVAEVTSNLIKHAGSGELLYRIQKEDNLPAFELICIDNGKGMADVSRMMKDGVSTANTLGHGLGAIERLSSFFQVYSIPGWGTMLYARVDTPKEVLARRPGHNLDIRGLSVSKTGENVCGDGYYVKHSNSDIQIFFGDGLGHGQHAKESVTKGVEAFLRCQETDPTIILRTIHEAVRKTRGMVAAVAVFDRKRLEWSLCSVGNILVRMYNGIMYKNHMGYNGIVGLHMPNSMKSSTVPSEKNQHLIMCSDGIRTRWDLARFPGIFKYDNTLLAAALYKDFSRGNDDASVLVAKVV